MRAITGAMVGTMGGFMSFLAALLLSWSVCDTPMESCGAENAGLADGLLWVGFLGGLAGTALVYGGLLRLCRRPRPWSVVVPGMVLSALPFAIPGVWELEGALYLPGAALAVAGVITGFRSRRSAHGQENPESG